MLNYLDYSKNIHKSGVYCITNRVDDRVYIGSSNCLRIRFSGHKKDLEKNKHNNIHLQRFHNKYGRDKLKFNILEICNIDELLEREQSYLDKGFNLFNIAKKAGTPPTTNRSLSEKDIKYISKLYKEGKTACQIAEILYGNRNSRSKINLILRGEIYPEYKNLFKYRQYTQKGKRRNKFSKINKENKEFIKKNIGKISNRKIAIHVNCCSNNTINSYINTLKNGM